MFKIIKNIIPKNEREKILYEFESSEKEVDYQVVGSNILYKWELSDFFCNKFKTIVEEFYSAKLIPVRSYTRKSLRGQTLTKHKDVTEIVMSIFIKQVGDGRNPLYLYIDDKKTEVLLEEGDAVIFEGSKIQHERLPIVSDWILGMYLGYERVNKVKLF